MKSNLIEVICKSFAEFLIMQIVTVYTQHQLRKKKSKKMVIEIEGKKRVKINGKVVYPSKENGKSN